MEEAFPKIYREHFNPIRAHKPRHVNPDWVVCMVCMFALGFLAGMILGAGL
jgi:hypothetical protein